MNKLANSIVTLSALIVCACAADSFAGTPVVITPDSQRMMDDAKKQGQSIAGAMLSRDYAKIAALTYPPVLKMMGGKDQAIETMKSQMEDPRSPAKLSAVTVDDPIELVDTGASVYVVLPQVMDLVTDQRHVQGTGCLLAISDDRGKTWSFVDGAPGESTVRKMLPNLPSTVKIPERSKLTPVSPPATSQADAATKPSIDLTNAEKWVAGFEGKSEAEVISILGKDFVRTEWKSNRLGGPKLVFKVGNRGKVALLFYEEQVQAALLTVDSGASN